MTPEIRAAAVRWMIEVDDPLDLMRVNWNTHDPFTQSGMWTIDEDSMTTVEGVRLMMDNGGGRKGFLLQLGDLDGNSWLVAIATYADKCAECGAQPHDAFFYPQSAYDEDGYFQGAAIDAWATGVIHGMWDNANTNGFESEHAEGCANGALSIVEAPITDEQIELIQEALKDVSEDA